MIDRTTGGGTDELDFSVTVDEANLLLEALGSMPFPLVDELIGKLQEQARSQLADSEPPELADSDSKGDSEGNSQGNSE